MQKVYIFDLDGTLALIDHRRHFVEGKQKDWAAFYQACVDDKPNEPVVEIFKQLRSAGNACFIWSGRSDEVKAETSLWLQKHLGIDDIDVEKSLVMRPANDFTPDDQLKRKWWDEFLFRDRVVAIFDDRQKVVDMWRSLGLTCCQVARGDF